MKFQVAIQWFKFDNLAYQKAYVQHMKKWTIEGGRIWLHAALESNPLPTWSGATRSTFSKLARALGTSVPMGPQRSRKNRKAMGRASGEGKVILDTKNDFFGFVYKSNLRYLNYNNLHRAVPGPPPQPAWREIENTPYNFDTKALAAWQEFTDKVDLPDPLKEKYLKKFRIT